MARPSVRRPTVGLPSHRSPHAIKQQTISNSCKYGAAKAQDSVRMPEKVLALQRKAERDVNSLTRTEIGKLVHGIPNKLRRRWTPDEIESALERGDIDLLYLSHAHMIDLNQAVLVMGERRLSSAFRLVDILLRHRKVNQHTSAMLFKACHRQGVINIVLPKLTAWAEAGMVGSVSATVLINSVLEHDVRLARKVFDTIRSLGVPMHILCYHKLMRVLGTAGMFLDAQHVFETLQEDAVDDNSLKLDAIAYQHILDAACTAKRWDYAHPLYRDAEERGVVLDGQLSATFMKAFGYAHEFDLVRQVHMTRVAASGDLDHHHFTALIMSRARRGDWQETWTLFERMRGAGVKVNEYTIVGLLTAAARSPRPTLEQVERVQVVLEEAGVKPNVYVYTAMLTALRNCQDLGGDAKVRAAEAQLLEMGASGVDVSCGLLNALIGLFWDCGNVARAWTVYRDMLARGIAPSWRTYNMMSAICSEMGRPEEAQKFLVLRNECDRAVPERR